MFGAERICISDCDPRGAISRCAYKSAKIRFCEIMAYSPEKKIKADFMNNAEQSYVIYNKHGDFFFLCIAFHIESLVQITHLKSCHLPMKRHQPPAHSGDMKLSNFTK